MGRGNAPTGHIRFGAFELDLRAGELRRNGAKQKLPDQPFQILCVLLENPGQVVTREDLRKRIWPTDTFVDFDHGLYTAITKLRQALGDSSEHPRFIETVPRRGYRFIAPIVKRPEENAVSRQQSAKELEVDPRRMAMAPSGVAATAAPTMPAAPRVPWRRVVVAAGMVAALLLGWPIFHSRRGPLTARDTIVLGDFTNTTGDVVFDGTLRQGLAAQLEQSPYLDILSDEQIAGTLRLMGQPAGARLTHELARQVCQRTGGGAVLEGSIAQIGSQYSLVLNAVNCSTGMLLASAQAVASDKNHVLGALSSVASSIRAKLGESLASIGKFNTPLADVTTPSLVALQAYTMGKEHILKGDDDNAPVLFFERAISLDPNFAIAYSDLGIVFATQGEDGLAAKNLTKAYELQDRVSEPEKFYITAHYQFLVTGNLQKAFQVCQLWAETYPRDDTPRSALSGIYFLLGEYDKAVAETRAAVKKNPTKGLNYADLALLYAFLDRLDEAEAVIHEVETNRLSSSAFTFVLYAIAFLKHDTAGMAEQVARAKGKPGAEDMMLYVESDTAAFSGQVARANDLTRRARASAQQAGRKKAAASYEAEAALREALVGDAAQSRKQAAGALKASNGQDTEAAAALALALAGDVARAQKLARDLAKRFPQGTIAQFNYLPTIRAAIALRQNSPAKAIADLQAASPYELGSPAFTIYQSLYPVYVRGQAYLAARQGAAAAAEFQKILDHPGVALNGMVGPLSYVGLARAKALSGDNTSARNAYHDFFALWQHADPDIPILQQAKAEYAKLQ